MSAAVIDGSTFPSTVGTQVRSSASGLVAPGAELYASRAAFRDAGVLLLERLARVGVGQLGRQQGVAGARRDRHVDRLALGQVLHGLDLVLNAHQPFEQRLGPRRAAGDVDIHRHHQIDALDDVVAVLVVRARRRRCRRPWR